MSLRLPSRYEDLDQAFRGRLKPNQPLLNLIKEAFSSIDISGGIRFIPIYGKSGSGKTSAALEIGTHLPELYVVQLPRKSIEDSTLFDKDIELFLKKAKTRRLVVVIDQYEEVAAEKTAIPSQFVERLSLLDRDRLRDRSIVFIWLTTSLHFQKSLSEATTRNRRILTSADFEIEGIDKSDWPGIIEETFQFHNQDRALSDFEIISNDLVEISEDHETIGSAIETTGLRLSKYNRSLHDLSTYQVIMLWPVTDGLRIARVQQFTDARQGYKLDWNAWFRQLNTDDQAALPVREYNRARLYFDIRLIPVAAADLHPLCKNLDDDKFEPSQSYLSRFESTHFFSVVAGRWRSETYAPLRERESKRADEAREWYAGVTNQPTLLGKRIAKCLNKLGIASDYEQTITSTHGKVRADVTANRTLITPPNVLIELKAFSPENTMPSTICDAVKTTLKRHAQFAGFLQRQ